MTMKKEYGFLTWTSFPSSLKLFNDEPGEVYRVDLFTLPVTPGSTLKVEINAKKKNVRFRNSGLVFEAFNGRWHYIPSASITVGVGTLDWLKYAGEPWTVPENFTEIRIALTGGSGSPEAPGITWFDDLKIYKDDKLIYDNYFTAFRPGKIVPVMVTPPEVLVRAWQRRKEKRVGGEVLRRPLAVVV